MTAVSTHEIRRTLSQVRGMLESLERKLEPEGHVPMDKYARRREVLQRIYWNDNRISREDLLALLHEFGTNYAWIGQQVSKGYLTLERDPRGSRYTVYSVTPKAIRDEDLTAEEEEIDAISRLSNEVFAEDWDSEEDSAYDSL